MMADSPSAGRIRPQVSAGADPSARDDVSFLLPLALSQPHQALAIAREILNQHQGVEVDSYAHQSVGIVLRDGGQVSSALQELRTALRCALATGSETRVGDVLATYGATLAIAGRSKEGLLELDRAVSLTRGATLARVRLRRAHVLGMLGRHPDALADLSLAIRQMRRSGDLLWEARSLNNRCQVYLAVGDINRAEADATRAGLLFDALGQELESIHAAHNRGLVEMGRGDLPTALSHLDAAAARYRQLDVPMPDLEIDRVRTLLAAGLALEAVAGMERALAQSEVQATKRAELLLTAATASLAAGHTGQAQSWAQEATRLFSRQSRSWWEVRSRLISAQAQYGAGSIDRRLLRTTLALAAASTKLKVEEAPMAHLLAGRIALAKGELDQAVASFGAAAQHRYSGPPLNRASGWLAVALGAQHRCSIAAGATGLWPRLGRPGRAPPLLRCRTQGLRHPARS